MKSLRFVLMAIVFLFVGTLFITPHAHAFLDDFEDGDLNLGENWFLGGKREGITMEANVVERNGSKRGHLYHFGSLGWDYSEIQLKKELSYSPGLHFDFEMETLALQNISCQASAGVYFNFLDSSDNSLGRTGWVSATYDISGIDWLTSVPQGSNDFYSLDVGDLVTSANVVDPASIAKVNFYFEAYSQYVSFPFETASTSELWVDNVTVTPEPISSLLFLSGGAVLFFRKKRKVKT